MDTDYYITKEDFLNLKPFSKGGTIIGDELYCRMPGDIFQAEKQLSELGSLDKTGEGICEKVFFFKVLRDPSNFGDVFNPLEEQENLIFKIIGAKIVGKYRIPPEEMEKELALIKAKIKLNEKNSNG